jgi:hypothetical protein
LFAHPWHQGYMAVSWCQVSPSKNGEQLGCTLAVCPHYKITWVPNKCTYKIDQDSPFGLRATNLLFPRLDTFSKQEYRKWIGCPLFPKDWIGENPSNPFRFEHLAYLVS